MFSPETLGYAFLGGVLPPLVWLYFLLKEDAKHPEPRALIALAFVAGMVGVAAALPIERGAQLVLAAGFPIILAWSTIEEVVKYAAAALFILWRNDVDEAPDYVIYMTTAALGFAAAENTLFLLAPLSGGHFHAALLAGLVTDNLRFLGSTLLHVVASACVGFALAFSFKKHSAIRVFFAGAGLILAIALHTGFNTLIISGDGAMSFLAFFLVWSAAVVFFAVFELLKFIQYPKRPA